MACVYALSMKHRILAFLLAVCSISCAWSDVLVYGYRQTGWPPNATYTGGVIRVSLPVAFYGETVKSRVLLNGHSMSVTYIENEAFLNCTRMTWLEMPSTISQIGNFAFRNCVALKSFTIPQKVTRLQNGVFLGCYRLATVTLPSVLTGYLGDAVFSGCTALKTINLSDCTISEIGHRAFRYCRSLQSIDIPPTVTTIWRHAFQGSGLTDITLPPNISNLYQAAFADCPDLSEVTFQNQSVRVSIRDSVFAGCRSLQKVNPPQLLIYIGQNSFENCVSLREMDIPGSATHIDVGAFRNCSSLRKVVLRGSMEYIADSAFVGCQSLDSVVSYIASPCTVSEAAFSGISPRCVLMVPYGCKHIYESAGWTAAVFKGGIREMPEPEGISRVRVVADSGQWYDLEGREVSRPAPGRIYINRGRKVLKR